MRVHFTAAARAELQSILEFYRGQSPGLDRELLSELTASIRLIRDQPFAYQVVSKGVRRCVVRRFPVGLFYRVAGEELVIAVVSHLQRSPRHWRDRLGE